MGGTHFRKPHAIYSRKLASASWSPYCFSKVLGGLESPIAWNFTLKLPPLPPARWLTSSLAVAQSPRGHRRHVATGSKFGSIRILSIVVFSCQVPCQTSFRPLSLGLKSIELSSAFWSHMTGRRWDTTWMPAFTVPFRFQLRRAQRRARR